MKTVALQILGEVSTREVIGIVVGAAGQGEGIDLDAMRRRMRILDKLEAAQGDAVELEDSDHALLVDLTKAAKWRVASRELLDVLDGIVTGQ